MLAWLLAAGLGPAAVAVPVNWAADALAGAAQRWFKRLRRTDDLSRLVRAATGTSVDLTPAEFVVVRKLLEDQQTWNVVGRGTVENLATRIADCLAPRDGRTAEDSHAAALTIVRGLLEFAVADLEPKLFQQVLMARLQRMETGQASALDEALLGLHARFDSVMDQLKLVLDRLPPGPARRGEIAVYLRTLIDWLNTDPWPRDPQFGASVLTPAAIERKLRIIARGRDREQDLDADGLAQQCGRLVILGGPGSGKTWLAKRTARRCAEDALEYLAEGGTLDEVELPLYTTCSHLFGAGGGIREAVVSSALDQLADLGGSRISTALGVFFAERNAPTLLVIDSLDEAHGPSERLRQVGTLPWRIVLTGRPSSWRNQLTINDTDESHRVGELQPLRYPGDVEPFIQRWFDGRPERGEALAAQIAPRPGLQQAATVPLILAFYCIVGGTGPLPEFRRDLYTRVLRRMLTGRWRGDDDRRPDADTCLQTLRAWAWDGAASNHPVSGVGTWTDDIPTERVLLGEADSDALDHVATPFGAHDVDTGKTLRRFIHQSIREYLVAEHVASLPVDQAVKVLLPHLWYDPDWEYAAPAALAMHPQRDQLLRKLICRAARSDHVPGDLSAIDARWEVRGLLARIVTESSEADWSPEAAEMIGHARADLARSGRIDDLGPAASWGTSNRKVREALLGLLANETQYGPRVAELVNAVVQLDPTSEDQRRAREALLGLLQGRITGWVAAELVSRVVQLDPTPEDQRRARDALLGVLPGQSDAAVAERLVGVVVQLDPTSEDQRRAREALLGLLPGQSDAAVAERLVGIVVQLTVTAEDRRRARDALLGLLVGESSSRVAKPLIDAVVQLAATAEDRRRAREALLGLLPGQSDAAVAERLVGIVVQLTVTAEDRRRARDALLGLLVGESSSRVAKPLIDAVVQLAATAEDRRRARDALLGLLQGPTPGWVAADLAAGVVQLDPRAVVQRQVRSALLGLLPDRGYAQVAERLVSVVVQLTVTAEDKRQVREALLGLLANETQYGPRVAELVNAVVQLDPTSEDQRRAREALLGLLQGRITGWVAAELVSRVVQLDPTPEDQRRARDALLGVLPGQSDAAVAERLVGVVVQLDPTSEDQRRAREALLGLLPGQSDAAVAERLVGIVVQLTVTAEDRRRARDALLGLLADEAEALSARLSRLADEADAVLSLLEIELPDLTSEDERRALSLGRAMANTLGRSMNDTTVAKWLVIGVVQLAATADDKRRARDALLGRLADETDGWIAGWLVDGVVQLDPTMDDKRRARDALLGRLADETDGGAANRLVAALVQLDLTVQDARPARKALLGLLAGQADLWHMLLLPRWVVPLAATADDRRQAREVLLALLPDQNDGAVAEGLVGVVFQLDPTAEDQRRAREALLGLLAGETSRRAAKPLIDVLVQLAATAEDKRSAREALLALLAGQTSHKVAIELIHAVVDLDPTLQDLNNCRACPVPPTGELLAALLAAVRRNSALADWLAAIPSLASLSAPDSYP